MSPLKTMSRSRSRSAASIADMSLESRRRAQEFEEKRDPFLDPITDEVMRRPIVCSDGYTYDESTLVTLGVYNNPGSGIRSPFTREKFSPLVVNVQLQGDILETYPDTAKAYEEERKARGGANPATFAALSPPPVTTGNRASPGVVFAPAEAVAP